MFRTPRQFKALFTQQVYANEPFCQSSQTEVSQPDLLCCPLYCGDRLILKTALRKYQVLLPRQEVCDKLEVWYKTEVMMTLSRA